MSLILNVVRVLMLCKKPTKACVVRAKLSKDGIFFKYILVYMIKNDLVETIPYDKTLIIRATEKGNSVVKLWIDINTLIGVSIVYLR